MALLSTTAVGPLATAVVVAPVAAVAAVSTTRRPGQPPGSASLTGSAATSRVVVAALAAALVPLAAVGGLIAACVGAAVAAVLAVATLGRSAGSAPPVAATLAPGVAAASLVLASGERGLVALALASAVCLWDLGAYCIGTSPTGGVVGAMAGTASVAVLAVLFAAVADPPLSGARPWVLFALVAVRAPIGVALGQRLAAGRHLPALRRLDSLLVAGPAWAVGAEILLHR